MFEGREAIRACVTSGVTTAEDVYDLVAALVHAADLVRPVEEISFE